jgi:hypothetical protein
VSACEYISPVTTDGRSVSLVWASGDGGQGNVGYEMALLKGIEFIHRETCDMLAAFLESTLEEGYC